MVKSGTKLGGEVLTEFLLNWEEPVLLWIQAHLRGPITDAFFAGYTTLGNMGLCWIILSAVMLFFKKTRKAGLAGLFALLVGFLCTNVVLKPLVGRPRPWLSVEGLSFLVTENDPHSFPSGHTCASFAAALAWRPYLSKRRANTALVCAFLMGFSRLYVGVHFPTDVLCGALIGGLSGYLVSKCEKNLSR